MLTQFGKAIRGLRVRHGMIMKDMADQLGISPAFLSAIETGKKNVPLKWVEPISQLFSLTDQEKTELDKAARESFISMKIDTARAGHAQKNAAVVFARNFESMSNEDARAIIDMLSRGRE